MIIEDSVEITKDKYLELKRDSSKVLSYAMELAEKKGYPSEGYDLWDPCLTVIEQKYYMKWTRNGSCDQERV